MRFRAIVWGALALAVLAVGLICAGCSSGGNENELVIPDFTKFNILVFDDTPGINDFAQEALDRLSASYTVTSTATDFLNTGAGQNWHLVIVDESAVSNSQLPSALESYYNAGGRLAISTTVLAQSFPTASLWSTLGASFASSSATTSSIFKWEPGHQLFNFPNTLPDLTGIATVPGTVLSNADALAGITMEPAAGQAALFVPTTRRAVLYSCLLRDATTDLNDNLVTDGVEYWENTFVYLMGQGNIIAAPFPGGPG